MKTGKSLSKEFISMINPSNARVVEMRALEAHYKVEKQGGFTALRLKLVI